MIEMINPRNSTVELGKNTKTGEDEQLELRRGEEIENEVRANYENSDVENSEEYESREPNKVYYVSEADDKASATHELRSHNE
jgi:hypothetical protein